MVVKASQEKVTTLLKDTITLLCRNGLDFKYKFTVDALIGVTLDDNDVFLISMKELVRSDNKSQEEESGENSRDSTDSRVHPSPRKRHKRKHREQDKTDVNVRVKAEPDPDPGDAYPISAPVRHSVEEQSPQDKEDFGLQSSHNDNAGPPSKIQTNQDDPNDDMEEADDFENEEDDDDDDDLVFVKQEASDSQQLACSYQDSQSFSQSSFSYSPRQKNFSLSDVALEPVGSENSSMWQQGMAQYGSPQHRPGMATATTAHDHMDPSQTQFQAQSPGQSQQVILTHRDPSRLTLFCRFCNKQFSSEKGFKLHENRHKGIFPYHCDICGQGFMVTSHLKGHMSNHTGQKPFSCQYCQQRFDYMHAMKAHVVSEHVNVKQ